MGDVINTNLNGALLPSEELHESKVKPEWTRITFVIITSFLGAGVLSLPYSLSQLAYVPFYTLLVFVSVGSIVASDCYGRLYQVCPKAKVLADVAREAFGRRGEQICRCAVMIYLGGIITIFQLTCTISLQEMIGGGCQAYLGLIVALLAFSALQARSMHDLSFISVIGSVAIIVPCIMLLIAIPLRGQRKHASSDIFWASSSTIVRKAVGAMDLSFAYAGQVIFIELQNGMAKPKDFMKSVYSSSAVMTLTYAIVAAVGYHFVGQHDLRDGEPISTKLAKGSPMLRAINAFVLLHILIAYAVRSLDVSPTLCRDAFDSGRRERAFSWYSSRTWQRRCSRSADNRCTRGLEYDNRLHSPWGVSCLLACSIFFRYHVARVCDLWSRIKLHISYPPRPQARSAHFASNSRYIQSPDIPQHPSGACWHCCLGH